MADKRELQDRELDNLFAVARSDRPVPSDDLIARILADAEAQVQVQVRPAEVPARSPGFIGAILSAIGGWPAATGLATATVAGLAIGLGAPTTLDTLSGGYFTSASGYELEDLLPSYTDILGEG